MTTSAVIENPRAKRLLSMIDVTSGDGLEIGPLFQPLVPREFPNIRFVDIYDGDELRSRYKHDPNVREDDIVDPDFVIMTENGPQTLVEAVGDAGPFDWAVASHVAEHVPDLIGWLGEIGELLVDNGLLLLVVPDCRFTFDACRPRTTVGQMLQAHHDRDQIPSVRAVFDHFSSVVTVNAAAIWQGTPPDPEAVCSEEEFAQAQANLSLTGQYVDSHVWLFTPETIVRQLATLSRLGDMPFVVESVANTEFCDHEFPVLLRRIPRALSPQEMISARKAGVQTWTDLDPAEVARAHGFGLEDDSTPEGSAAAEPLADDSQMEVSDKERRLIERKRSVLLALRRAKGLLRRH
ncbi:methyltransferase family protein [Jatrophihabitans sp. GAS493]|uniref:methyltransferase domain-containing protein n=1 Tax=Jatrophihabitans sp. GAS493 TaxID=1907575 RepID=UPI000BB8B145|nr:methyltransferase domain-containing protein [Jatrophihabitans sp. GAS493]SOD70608.1 methyltransferase family protein [Jatrophihabitans sp. GAS493]